ncbi:hypothetical protein BD626DRAFT_510559 [Schizophyllum amplum]|uniref:Uncharacterized protein n=1 Tax=Schizophyllum amplum TaxID=97359 RepID=A0A550C1V4_9AGAR|nr:hypothetical protein BD626DRAFT_510559 [Auriculariopsis ampla]
MMRTVGCKGEGVFISDLRRRTYAPATCVFLTTFRRVLDDHSCVFSTTFEPTRRDASVSLSRHERFLVGTRCLPACVILTAVAYLGDGYLYLLTYLPNISFLHPSWLTLSGVRSVFGPGFFCVSTVFPANRLPARPSSCHPSSPPPVFITTRLPYHPSVCSRRLSVSPDMTIIY